MSRPADLIGARLDPGSLTQQQQLNGRDGENLNRLIIISNNTGEESLALFKFKFVQLFFFRGAQKKESNCLRDIVYDFYRA